MIGEVFPVLAHYGGLDEVGVLVVPVVAAILLLRWAERRAADKTGGPAEDPADGAADSPEHAPVLTPESTKLAADE